MLRRSAASVVVFAAVFGLACGRSPEAKEARFLKAGKEQFQRKDYNRAILQFKNAIQAMPKDPEPYYQLGLSYMATGDLRTAVACFRKATELNPQHADAQLMLAQIMTISNDQEVLEQAAKRIEDILKLVPDSVPALNVLATTELRLGRPEDAEKHLQEALKRAPANLQSSIALANVRLSQKDAKGAEDILRQAVQQAPKTAAPLVTLGDLYVAMRRDAEAEQQYAAALNVEPNNGQALRAIGAMQFRAGQNEKAEQTYLRLSQLPGKEYKPLHALFLFQIGKREAAVAELEKLAKADPADRDTRVRLIRGYLALNRVADAEKLLTAALQKNKKDTDALLERSRIYLGTAKYREAQADLNEVVRLRPDSAEAHYVLAQVHAATGDLANRQQELGAALKINPRFLAARLDLAKVLIGINAGKSALTLLDEVPTEQKQAPVLLVQRNWALAAVGDKAGFQKGVEALLAKARTPEVLIQNALARFDTKDILGGRASLEEALQVNPEELRALRLLVSSYAAQNQNAAGTQKARDYAARAPKSAPIQQFFGEVLRSTGNPSDARKAFEAAKASNPAFVAADLAIAQLDAAEGKVEAARKNLSAVLNVNPKNKSARLLLAEVEVKAANHTAALEHYRKVLDEDQRNTLALNNLAYILTEHANQPDEGLKSAQLAKELTPDNAAVDDTLGWIYYRKGIYLTAVKHLESSVAKEATALHRYHLGMAYLKAGDYKRGKQTIDAALKMDTKLPEAQAARELLAEASKKTQ